jgi:hypothetical protein
MIMVGCSILALAAAISNLDLLLDISVIYDKEKSTKIIPKIKEELASISSR